MSVGAGTAGHRETYLIDIVQRFGMSDEDKSGWH